MKLDPTVLRASDAEAIDAQASKFMKRGIRLMNDAQPDAVAAALVCFGRALELRSRLPVDAVPLFRYGLAACWLNRADALIRQGDAAQLPAALRAYDEGIALLLCLPLGEDARFPRRLAIAFQNRGLALQAHGPLGTAEAIAAFMDAIAVLDHAQSTPIPDRRYLLAAVWVNLANARASETDAQSGVLARDAALRAMALVADLEAEDADATEVGLRARHVLCRALSTGLSTANPQETLPDDVHEATDIVDDGLSLVRRWEQRGSDRFRPVAYDLFRFGARVYGRYQPQFLNEFVFDNIDPGQSSSDYVESAEMRSAAMETLEFAKGAAC